MLSSTATSVGETPVNERKVYLSGVVMNKQQKGSTHQTALPFSSSCFIYCTFNQRFVLLLFFSLSSPYFLTSTFIQHTLFYQLNTYLVCEYNSSRLDVVLVKFLCISTHTLPLSLRILVVSSCLIALSLNYDLQS